MNRSRRAYRTAEARPASVRRTGFDTADRERVIRGFAQAIR